VSVLSDLKLSTVIPLQYTTVKPLADRVLLKTRTAELKTTGGILLPSTAQSKPQSGEVVAIGEGRIIGDNKVEVSIQVLLLAENCDWQSVCSSHMSSILVITNPVKRQAKMPSVQILGFYKHYAVLYSV
jgi:hypothetical protein